MKTRVRLSEEGDAPYLKKWLLMPDVLRWFPMTNELEIDDAIRLWISYAAQKSAFTIEINGEVAGMAVLYLNAFHHLKHQALFAIIMGEGFRGKGGGTILYQALETEAIGLGIRLIHLEVYEGNPARGLYKKLGFTQYGEHPRFLKEGEQYITKILMQKDLYGRS